MRPPGRSPRDAPAPPHRPGGYGLRLVVLTFVGAHLPLAASAAYLVAAPAFGDALPLLGVILAATLAGTALALGALAAVLLPLLRTTDALATYLEDGTAPVLPTGRGGPAGRLMREARRVIERLDERASELRLLADLDHLTGVYNRRAGEQRLREHLAAARRDGARVALALADLDGLKTLNDEHGHAFGDACIRHVADTLRGALRGDDWIARWGGDEFLLGSRTASDGFAPALDRAAAALRRRPVDIPNAPPVILTLSIGVTEAAPGEEADRLFARADRALYAAKAAGRDRLARDLPDDDAPAPSGGV